MATPKSLTLKPGKSELSCESLVDYWLSARKKNLGGQKAIIHVFKTTGYFSFVISILFILGDNNVLGEGKSR